MSQSIIARYDDNILRSGTITSTFAPLTSYALATMNTDNPAARVLFGVKTVTLTWTLGSPALGDILVIPTSNLEGAVLTLTNGAGFSHAISIPTMTVNRIPLTLVVDLTLLSGTRTSNVWNLVIVSNVNNVVMGGAVYIFGPKRQLTPQDIIFGYTYSKQRAGTDTANIYLTRYRQDFQTQVRSIAGIILCSKTQLIDLEAWFDDCAGSVLPGLLWMDPTVEDAFIGTLMNPYVVNHKEGNVYEVPISFNELSKGKPV